MADRGDTHYYGRTLHRWFAISSVVLLLSVFWMVVDDFYAPWKVYQREFFALDQQKTEALLASEELQAAAREEDELQRALADADDALEQQGKAVEEAEESVFLAKGDFDNAVYLEKKQKEDIGWAVFHFEELKQELRQGGFEVEGNEVVEEEAAHLKQMYDELYRRTAVREQDENDHAEAVDRLAALTAGRDEAEKAAKEAAKELELLRTKLDKLAPEAPAGRLAKLVRDGVPGLDFVGPTIKVDKVILPDLSFELNFTKGLRIDMCRTCHMGVDSEGWEEDEQPFTTHPRLDLYLSSSSPHPYKDVGCTICHRGGGQALDFQRADHRPSDEAEAKRWKDEFHWHKQHHWDYPMLSSDYIEASCVQCHKDSMELIADDAPRVSQGYQNFERYGCYACHKLEWFPEDRRPGPSLANLQQKLEADWTAAWIEKPKAFRPTTWMPQFFHLENYAPEEVIATSNWGEGRDILGQEWNDAAVTAITSFLFDNHPLDPLPPVPVEGDPARGREEFRLVGCLACHNVAPFEEADLDLSGFPDPALMHRGENEHGPNLRGIATKVDATWLYWWLVDPEVYWSETRMPDLRLSDQQAADIAAYIMDPEDPEGFFTDVPDGWTEGFPEFTDGGEAQKREVLMEQARWFFRRDGQARVESRFEDPERWADTDAGNRKLAFDVGQRFVMNQGCFSCHEIAGMEDTMPIGTEFTTWGSKTVDKLDWGFIADHLATEKLREELGDPNASPESHYNDWFKIKKELKEYRENWVTQKLSAPRSFDKDRVRIPLDRLRMPYFGFTEEEVAEIVTFMVGLVDDEVQDAALVPTEAEAAMDHGLRVIRQKNCAGCHVIEPGEIDLLDADGDPHTVRGEITWVDEVTQLPPLMDRWDEYRADYEAYFQEEDPEYRLEEVIVRLLRTEPDFTTGPNTGDVSNSLILDPDQIRAARSAWGGDFVDVVTNYYRKGLVDPRDPEGLAYLMPDPEGGVYDVDGESRFYYEEDYDKLRWTFAPPVLIEEGRKVQKDWFYEFLVDPMPIRNQMRSRMPSFNWREGEAEAVADYFAQVAAQDHPSRFTRKLRQHVAAAEGGATPADLAAAVNAAVPGAGVKGSTVSGVESGDRNAIKSGFAALEAFASTLEGFHQNRWGAVAPGFEAVRRRSQTHLDEVSAKLGGDHFAAATVLALDERTEDGTPLGKGVNCTTCHFLHGNPPPDNPIAWAPELYRLRERLREDWVDEWVRNPLVIYPGTAMPANFPADQEQWQAAYPGTTEEQIQATLDWVFNLDRVYPPPRMQ